MPHVDYIVNGVKYPSVTEVLAGKPKPWLQAWKDKWGALADRKTSAASRIGTAFHAGAEQLVHGKWITSGDRRLYGMLATFELWLEQAQFRPKDTELHVVSAVHKFHGTLDAVGYTKDHKRSLVLFDWKTSASIYPEMQIQLAAYALAYKEQTGLDIKHGMIVLVSKDKPHHMLTVREYKLGKRLANKFLKRLGEFNEAHA